MNGYLQKKSLHLKQFRKRWMVLTNGTLFSYKNEKKSQLTETINLNTFKCVQTAAGVNSKSKLGEFELIPIGKQDKIRTFIAESIIESQEWITAIKQEIESQHNDDDDNYEVNRANPFDNDHVIKRINIYNGLDAEIDHDNIYKDITINQNYLNANDIENTCEQNQLREIKKNNNAKDEKKSEKNYFDCFGAIKDRLTYGNILCSIFGRNEFKTKMALQLREDEKKRKDKPNRKCNETEMNEYPRQFRFLSVLDLRDKKKSNLKSSNNKHELLIFEPPRDCFKFPPEDRKCDDLWNFNSSKTCIIPADESDEKNKLKSITKKQNAQSVAHKMMTLSYHVKEDDCVKCYLFMNGQYVRFMADDLPNIIQNQQNDWGLSKFVNEWNKQSTKTNINLTHITECFKRNNINSEYLKRNTRKQFTDLLTRECSITKAAGNKLWKYLNSDTKQLDFTSSITWTDYTDKITEILTNSARRETIIGQTQWNKIKVLNKTNKNSKNIQLCMEQSQFMASLNGVAGNMDVKLVPIVAFDDDEKKRCIFYVWIVSMNECGDIGVSFKYDPCNDTVAVNALYLDETQLSECHNLLPSHNACTCVDINNFCSNIDYLTIIGADYCDYDEGQWMDCKYKYAQYKSLIQKLANNPESTRLYSEMRQILVG